MKFSEFLKNIDYFDIWPIISLILFFAVFVGVVIYAFSAKREEMDDNAKIPLK